MRTFILIFIVLSNFNLLALNTFDSLKVELNKVEADSAKITLLITLSQYCSKSIPDSAENYIKQLRKLSNIYTNKKGIVNADISQSVALAHLGNLKESNEFLFKAEKNAVKYKQINELNNVYLTLGINFLRLGEYDRAVEYLLKSKELAEKYNNNDYLGRTLITLGLYYGKSSDVDKELEYLNQAKDIFEKTHNIKMLSNVYNNLSSSYIDLKDYKKALDYINKSIEYDTKTNDLQGLAVSYHNKGSILYYLDSIPKAIKSMEKAIVIKKQLNNKMSYAISLLGLGDISREIKQYNRSEKYYLEALDILKSSNALSALSSAYFSLDSLYVSLQDFEKAYNYQKMAYQLQDSIFNLEKQKTIEELNTKYDVAAKEADNVRLQRKSDKQFFIIIIVLLIVSIFFILAVILYYKQKSLKKVNNMLNEKNEHINHQNEELELLNEDLTVANKNLYDLNATKDRFFSIISHDLKSPISASYQLVDTLRKHFDMFDEAEKIESLDLLYESTYNTYYLLENLLTWSQSQRDKIEYNPSEINVHDLINITIAPLLQTANQKNIDLKNNVENEMLCYADMNMLSTIFRNIINNAIKFSYDGGIVNITSETIAKNVIIKVEDKGIGMSEKDIDNLFKIDKAKSKPGTNNEKGTGLGLIIVKEFVNKNKGEIKVESEKGKGSTFTVILPVDKIYSDKL